MTDEQTEQSSVPEAKISFRDREMRVVFPQPEQIMVWRRIMARLEKADIKDWNGREVLDALEKIRTIIDTVLPDEADVTWLDDEMMAGRLGIKEASGILMEATKAFQNRAQNRAAKTAPARRKAPAKIVPAKKTARSKS